MPLPKLLRHIAPLMMLPGIAAMLVAMIAWGPDAGRFVLWCTRYWYITILSGCVLMFLLHATAWLLQRFRGPGPGDTPPPTSGTRARARRSAMIGRIPGREP